MLCPHGNLPCLYRCGCTVVMCIYLRYWPEFSCTPSACKVNKRLSLSMGDIKWLICLSFSSLWVIRFNGKSDFGVKGSAKNLLRPAMLQLQWLFSDKCWRLDSALTKANENHSNFKVLENIRTNFVASGCCSVSTKCDHMYPWLLLNICRLCLFIKSIYTGIYVAFCDYLGLKTHVSGLYRFVALLPISYLLQKVPF